MSVFRQYAPILLGDDEQVVLAVDGRVLPSLSDFIFIVLFAPAWIIAPLIILHRLFRPISYVITTGRILVFEPKRMVDEIRLDEIIRMKGSRSSLMVFGSKKRLWLARLPDAWFFETLIRNVIKKVSLEIRH